MAFAHFVEGTLELLKARNRVVAGFNAVVDQLRMVVHPVSRGSNNVAFLFGEEITNDILETKFTHPQNEIQREKPLFSDLFAIPSVSNWLPRCVLKTFRCFRH